MKLSKGSDGYWHVEVMTEAGQRKSVCTWCMGRPEAESIVASAKVREIERAAAAHRLTAEVVTLITANRNVTVNSAVSEWEEWMRIGVRSPRTRDNNLTSVRAWVSASVLGEQPVSSITSEHVHAWVNSPSSKDKLGTRKMKLSCIRNFMNFCGVKRYVLSNPSMLVSVDYRAMSHEQRETRHKAVFTEDEVDFIASMSEDAEPDWMSQGFFRSAVILGRDLALRLGDICNLEWSCFDMARGVVVVWTDKSNARVEIPITDRVRRLVESLPRSDPRFVFPAEQAVISDPRKRSSISVYFCRFLKSLGLSGYSFHSLRATMATSMAIKGATVEEIAKALGHKGTAVTRSYIRRDGASKSPAKGGVL